MTKIPKFKNQNLFKQAFTHRSFLNETKQKLQSNERLEFLGDSILSFLVSEYLYAAYPQANEGTLTNLRSTLVNTKSLSKLARELNFGSYLILSKGEEEAKGNENKALLENSFEAFIGALFLDQGIEKTREFLHEILLNKAKEALSNIELKDPKSILQEYVQAKKHNSPIYKVLNEQGPAHARIFTIGVYVANECLGTGEGHSKQQAQELAAAKALEKLGK